MIFRVLDISRDGKLSVRAFACNEKGIHCSGKLRPNGWLLKNDRTGEVFNVDESRWDDKKVRYELFLTGGYGSLYNQGVQADDSLVAIIPHDDPPPIPPRRVIDCWQCHGTGRLTSDDLQRMIREAGKS